jgi:hypothetical protein
MAAPTPPTRDPVVSLSAAVADPFVEAPYDAEDDFVPFTGRNIDITVASLSSPILQWYSLAQQEAPLWCFDKVAFRSLQPGGVPSSHPLALYRPAPHLERMSDALGGFGMGEVLFIMAVVGCLFYSARNGRPR